MAQLQNPFNAQQFDPKQSGAIQQLTPGKHPVVIIASEIKAAKDQESGLIEFELEAIDGPNKGMHQIHRVNLYNKSEKARQIAEGQMAALSYVTGVFLVQDTQQLHGKPFVVDIVAQPLTAEQQQKLQAGEQVTPFTQVSKVLHMDGSEPKAGQQAGGQQQGNAGFGGAQPQTNNQPAATGGSNPAWGGNGGGNANTGAASTPNANPSWGGGNATANNNAGAASGNANANWAPGAGGGATPTWGR